MSNQTTTIDPKGIILSKSIQPLLTDPVTGEPCMVDVDAVHKLQGITGYLVGEATPKTAARQTCQHFFGLGKNRRLESSGGRSYLEILGDDERVDDQGKRAYPVLRTYIINHADDSVICQDQHGKSIDCPQRIAEFYARACKAPDSYKLRKILNEWIKVNGGIAIAKNGPYWLPIEKHEEAKALRAACAPLGAHVSIAVLDKESLEDHAEAAMKRLAAMNHECRADLEALAKDGDHKAAVEKLKAWKTEVEAAGSLLGALGSAKGTLEGLYNDTLNLIVGQTSEPTIEAVTEREPDPVESIGAIEIASPVSQTEPEQVDPGLADLDFDIL